MLSGPSKLPSNKLTSLSTWSSSSSDIVAPVPSPGETPAHAIRGNDYNFGTHEYPMQLLTDQSIKEVDF
jgi:hypothetical protein